MADIYIRCPSITCRQVLTVPAESRGMLVTCKYCKCAIRIPVERRDARAGVAVATSASPSPRPGK